MRSISFYNFKESCKHLNEYFYVESGRSHCGHVCNEGKASFTSGGKKYAYRPCTENNCPVLGGCKKL